MSKERWCEVYDDFITENEREPTDQEMQDAWENYCEGIRGCYE